MNTHLPAFLVFFRFFASFCIGQISHQQEQKLRCTLGIFVCIFDTFDNILEVKNDFTNCLIESFRLCSE